MTKAAVEITGESASFNRAVDEANAKIKSLSAAAERASSDMAESFGKLRNLGLQVLAALGLQELGRQSLEASLKLEKMANTIKFASGTAEETAKNNEFLRKTVKDLGLDLVTSGEAFAKLAAAARGTKLEGEGARSIFDAVAKASTAMGLSVDQTQGALLAISQMISKGTVQSEELRGQLGERLPGAFQIAARAMGVTTEELGNLLEKGMVPAAEFLPRFAAQLRVEMGDAARQAADSLQAALNRMTSAKTEAVAALQNADLTKAFLGGFTEFLESVPGSLQKFQVDVKRWADEVAMIFAALADVVTLPVRAAQNITDDVGAYMARQTFRAQELWELLKGNKEQAKRFGDMATEVRGGNRSATPFADTLRANRARAAGPEGQAEAAGFAEIEALRVAQQRAADEALLRTRPNLGAGKDKEAEKAAREEEQRRKKLLEEERKDLTKYAEEQFKLWGEEVTVWNEVTQEREQITRREYENRMRLAKDAATKIREIETKDLNRFFGAYEDIRLDPAATNQLSRDINQMQAKEMDDLIRRTYTNVERTTDAWKDFGFTAESAFEKAILGGEKLSSVLQGLVQDIARIAIRKTILEPGTNLAQSGIAALGNIFGAFFGNYSGYQLGASGVGTADLAGGSFAQYAGQRAVGGYVEAGQLYRVNEGGIAEGFRPRMSGEVVPLTTGGAQAQPVQQTVNFYGVTGETVRSMVYRMLPEIAAATRADWASRRSAGGSFARA